MCIRDRTLTQGYHCTAALILWQSTRHLDAESRYPGKITITVKKLLSLSTAHLAINDAQAEWSAFSHPLYTFVVLLQRCDITHGMRLSLSQYNK